MKGKDHIGSWIKTVIFMLLLAASLAGCASSRKSFSELRGLMLLDKLQLSRNREFYSRHNEKVKRDAYRRYMKNGLNR